MRLSLVYIVAVTLLLLGSVQLKAQSGAAQLWADSILQNMTLDQKIGQLFMIRAHSDLGDDHIKSVEKLIKEFHVGGLCFFQGTPRKQAELTNKYQSLSSIPMMVALDAEWGLGMRHKKNALSYPKQMTLGAISDNTLIYDMGIDIAKQLRRIGTHVNFAPVADVNNNPENPVIHNRSFGEDIYNVATKCYAYMKGLQDASVMACAKHFPGHGDTDVDSHYDLPVITHSKERLDSLELMPFRVLTQLGVKSMMSAHLSVPALDDRENRPASLSNKVLEGLLREQMNFNGLIFTDGLEMKGVAKHFEPGQMEVEAIKAGNDILLLPINTPKAFTALKEAVENNEIPLAKLDEKVRRILEAKHFLKLNEYSSVNALDSIGTDIKDKKSLALISRLYEKAMTLAKDELRAVPIKDEDIPRTASLSIGAESDNIFQKRLADFGVSTNISIEKSIDAAKMSKVLSDLRSSEDVIISIHDMSIFKSRDFGITKSAFDLIYRLNNEKNVILVIFGTPYSLDFFNDIPTIMVGYEDNDIAQDAAAQAIMGVTRIEGKLPITVNDNFLIKSGVQRLGIFRLGYSIPEAVGISSDSLLAIDTIVQEMLNKKATPGCQILAARNGRIFFQKSYGKHTPDGRKMVDNDDVYDVASVTKILSTTISLMKLYDEGKLNLYEKLENYIPNIDTTNKAKLIIEDILAHHAGLPGWIPFYERTLDEESRSAQRKDEYYSEIESDSFGIMVCNNLFLRNDWRDSIFNLIYSCDLRESRDYRYSDLGFYLFQQLIESSSNKSLDRYAYDNYYRPLNLKRTFYNPVDYLETEEIVPSEKDNYFRDCVLHGHVHDMGAAMLGGVAGHAGLFSNAKELAILMQMLLNGGSYGGRNYLKPQTIERFTKRYYKSSRRGLGFDMKEINPDRTLNMAEEASELTFGHLGFTGIAVFADPKYDLIYIMLANRTYPSMKNYIFGKENYRPRIQSVFYRAINDTNI